MKTFAGDGRCFIEANTVPLISLDQLLSQGIVQVLRFTTQNVDVELKIFPSLGFKFLHLGRVGL